MESERVLRAERVVDAPPERVWELLVDLPNWDRWNPTLFKVHPGSRLEVGQEVRMSLALGPVTVPMRQQIRSVDPPRELQWRSKQLVPAQALDVVRSFWLEPLEGGRTRFVQSETMTGFLAVPTAFTLGRLIVQGYENMSRALADHLTNREV